MFLKFLLDFFLFRIFFIIELFSSSILNFIEFILIISFFLSSST